MYGEQMFRMAQSLEIHVVTSDHKPKDKILGHRHAESLDVSAFPMLEGLLNLTQELW